MKKIASLASVLALAACGGGGDGAALLGSGEVALPVLSPATGATLSSCATLASSLTLANTRITAANPIAAGVLTVAGKPIEAHCQVLGKMAERISPVDGKSYAVGFEMRLPTQWNGRFFYQANGGLDGSVATALGAHGGGALNNALNMGFAVISSDAGHGSPDPSFGLDPQARLDYGYQAVAKLTPMAKALIKAAYGKAPDRSYFGGCSNGGRHTMVAASRYANDYDGFLVGDPGFNLPLAATANIAGAQTYAALAATPGDLSTGFSTPERTLVSNAILSKCDALDGVKDGLIQDTNACQAAFDLDRDVPTCSTTRDGSCLSADQKKGIAQLFAGALTGSGKKIYASFPYDAGLVPSGWASWKFTSPTTRDAGAVGLVWQAPPEDLATFNGSNFALHGDLDSMLAKVFATTTLYTESAMSFMTPPSPTDLGTLKKRGAKMMVYHGTSDPIFSSNDTQNWYEGLRAANGGDASNFARFYRVPGMLHCSGGPATDQFDMLTPLVNWVEKGEATESVVATARGAGNAGGINADVPADWAADRSRPLCSYPKVARYKGTGSIDKADSFSCQ